MNDTYIVTAYVVLDDLLKVVQYEDDRRAQLSAAEILTVAVVAAKYFQYPLRANGLRNPQEAG